MRGLDITGMRITFDASVAVDAVDLAVPGHAVTAIIGPSGCGKSTLLRGIAGLEPLAGGTVCFDGEDQAGIPVHRRGFGLMFQEAQLFEHLEVTANVAYGLRRRGWDPERRTARVASLLDMVGLPGFGPRRPGTLSGGERQRVALARALAPEPRLLLLDEPLSALDHALRVRLAGELRDILTRTRTTALLVTHDHEEAFSVADHVAVMREGRIIQRGTPREVWAAPADIDAAEFLGYGTVLRGDAADEIARVFPALGGGRAIALRRDGLRADDGPLPGTVQAVAPGLAADRLRVLIRGGAVVDAVAAIDATPAPGDAVGLTLTPGGAAVIPIDDATGS